MHPITQSALSIVKLICEPLKVDTRLKTKRGKRKGSVIYTCDSLQDAKFDEAALKAEVSRFDQLDSTDIQAALVGLHRADLPQHNGRKFPSWHHYVRWLAEDVLGWRRELTTDLADADSWLKSEILRESSVLPNNGWEARAIGHDLQRFVEEVLQSVPRAAKAILGEYGEEQYRESFALFCEIEDEGVGAARAFWDYTRDAMEFLAVTDLDGRLEGIAAQLTSAIETPGRFETKTRLSLRTLQDALTSSWGISKWDDKIARVKGLRGLQ